LEPTGLLREHFGAHRVAEIGLTTIITTKNHEDALTTTIYHINEISILPELYFLFIFIIPIPFSFSFGFLLLGIHGGSLSAPKTLKI